MFRAKVVILLFPSVASEAFAILLVISIILHITTAICPEFQPEHGCRHVKTWYELKNYLEKASEEICFDGFDVNKEENEEHIEIRGANVTVSCQKYKRCQISGMGRHLMILGHRSNVTISGFTFEGATNTAVVVDSRKGLQSFCFCDFIRNRSNRPFAGGLKGLSKSSIYVESCLFSANNSRTGSAIYFRGKALQVIDSDFQHNAGNAIYFGRSSDKITASSILRGSMFLGNQNSSEAMVLGVKEAENDIAVVDGGGNTAAGHILCDGIHSMSDGKCSKFTKCEDKSGNFRDHMGKLRECNWLHSVSRRKKNCGTSRHPRTELGDNCSFTCREYIECDKPDQIEPSEELDIIQGLTISPGISVRVIAKAGEVVNFTSSDALNSKSDAPFHSMPDGAASFPLDNGEWAYVSNSEELDKSGGVYAIYFDKFGKVKDYQVLLQNTTRNCSGGRTPHESWISCEEISGGHCWQVDPTGKKEGEKTMLGGKDGGRFEAVAVDNREPLKPIYFVTEDKMNGAVRKYTPPDGYNGWGSLHAVGGEIKYLNFLSNGTFEWTKSLAKGKRSAINNYQNTEGISFHDGKLYFVAKREKQFFTLDLNTHSYQVEYTNEGTFKGKGKFNGHPDQAIIASDRHICLTEDGGATPGVFCRDIESGIYHTVFESDDIRYRGDETTGLALSPDKKILYACLQDCGCNATEAPERCGCCMEFWRQDGLPFDAFTLNLKYHMNKI